MTTSRELLRSQFKLAHQLLAGIMNDEVTDAVAASVPAGNVQPIGTIYAHLALAEDWFISARGYERPTLFETGGWAEKTGITAAMSPRMVPEWLEGATALNMAGVREYATAVFAQTDDALEFLGDAALAREVDAPLGGMTTVEGLFASLGVYHLVEHSGEIAALKGIQELKGLPF